MHVTKILQNFQRFVRIVTRRCFPPSSWTQSQPKTLLGRRYSNPSRARSNFTSVSQSLPDFELLDLFQMHETISRGLIASNFTLLLVQKRIYVACQ